ncbi:uncharacterized protein [Polyergus mexicanus]|uniref:uncharacterized protein n=1 Tax=Polyergus mexicanus TaxID=615972 RepID=UPI0038B44634
MNEMGSGTRLPRVADLEQSVQWTSLANDIDDLERRRRRADDRPMAYTIERHTYQRGSMPEIQRACTIRCDDDRDALSQRDPDNYPEPENSRWSWKPRTDFEREYFYKDYKDYYGDPGARFKPAVYEVSAEDPSYLQVESRRPYGSPARFSSLARHPVGLEKEHFSDSRDRLHEIFEHNRYLRRQFFADTTGNKQRDCNGLHFRNLSRGNQTSRRCTGFGSTETLTSQSNQSSMSSINDRKSRTQTTRTPEEEENALVEVARRNNVVPRRKFNVNSSRVDRKSDVRRDGKVLVNILPGSEIRRVDVTNAPTVNLEEANNERNETDAGAWRQKRGLPEYIFGGDTKIDSRRDGTLPSRYNKNHRDAGDGAERNWNRLSRNEIYPRTISEGERLECFSINFGSRSDGGTCRNLCKSMPNLTIRKQNLDAPLYVARAFNVPEERSSSDGYALESHIARSCHGSSQCREQRTGRCEGPTRSIGREQSISEATTVSLERLTPRSKVGTRVPPPPPLDLSMVNEQCERMEADERRYLNDYSVDVAILRSHEDLAKDLLIVAENERWDRVKGIAGDGIDNGGPSPNDRSCGRNDGRRTSFPRKSREDLSLANDLRSPQLVKDCKGFTSDLPMTVDPVRIHTRPIDPDASRRDRRASSPLFDQTNPIGGLCAAGSTLRSTVYGPIPYSQ